MEIDIFKALADPSRRKLLDLLHASGGRTLSDLCEPLDMSRFGLMKHLRILPKQLKLRYFSRKVLAKYKGIGKYSSIDANTKEAAS